MFKKARKKKRGHSFASAKLWRIIFALLHQVLHRLGFGCYSGCIFDSGNIFAHTKSPLAIICKGFYIPWAWLPYLFLSSWSFRSLTSECVLPYCGCPAWKNNFYAEFLYIHRTGLFYLLLSLLLSRHLHFNLLVAFLIPKWIIYHVHFIPSGIAYW